MHHVGAVARFAAKVLTEQLGDIGLVVDNQDAALSWVTMSQLIESPRPVPSPVGLVVKNG